MGTTLVKEQKVTLDLSKVTAAELKELMEAAKRNENRLLNERKDAYEAIRAEVVHRIIRQVEAVTTDVECLHTFVSEETEAFKSIMEEYGRLRSGGQMSFSIQDGNYRVEVKSNKVKKFDERADVAAARLIEFLQEWINKADNGTENPMYQLAMVLLDRNKDGDLDYKNISKLYQLESKFNDEEYSAIMELFKESHLVEGNATKFYFWKKDDKEVWRKIEPSFNRL